MLFFMLNRVAEANGFDNITLAKEQRPAHLPNMARLTQQD
jgi:hypothetical protein